MTDDLKQKMKEYKKKDCEAKKLNNKNKQNVYNYFDGLQNDSSY